MGILYWVGLVFTCLVVAWIFPLFEKPKSCGIEQANNYVTPFYWYTCTGLNVKYIKTHPEAVAPKYAYAGDAAVDLTAVDNGTWYHNGRYCEYNTGLNIEIPAGYVGLIFPRSSVSNYDLNLANSVAVIDSNYRGEIKLRFRSSLGDASKGSVLPFSYKKGDRIGQLMIIPIPLLTFTETAAFSTSERGAAGFGSSNKKAYLGGVPATNTASKPDDVR